MLEKLSDSWMLKPENFRKLQAMRKHVRQETGTDIHLTSENQVEALLALGSKSSSPRMKVWAVELRSLMEEELASPN